MNIQKPVRIFPIPTIGVGDYFFPSSRNIPKMPGTAMTLSASSSSSQRIKQMVL
ncbi:hypothetical protein GHT06_008211 [Daphnia sinensis]|uniref:Uncharacterized protein n=1 Tax=Daphnia sinensis TaxID=1820382 RepID=A0AAD5L3T6_9CRUS|nr:hypothetical protein GHT06_008211 [Daphnia sinensis]